MRYGLLLLPVLLLSALPGFYTTAHGEESLLIFAGAASKPPTEEAARVFEKKTGTKVDLVFGGSGFVLSQMILAKKGDIYFPGSSDFMEIAKKKGAVIAETEQKVVYLVQAINVQKGNPKGIFNLRDLARPGVRVAIANPEGVCVGLYAVETIEKEFSAAEKAAFKRNLMNYTESCEKTATAISLKTVDAVIGWSVFQHWDPERIETVPLKKSEISRIGYIPIAVSSFSNNRARARQFIDFLLGDTLRQDVVKGDTLRQDVPKGKAIYRKYHYFMSPEEASAWIGATKPVGGEYALPADWRPK